MDEIIEKKIRKIFGEIELKHIDSKLGFYGRYYHSLKYGDFYLVNVIYNLKNTPNKKYSIDYIIKENDLKLVVYVEPENFEMLKALTVIGKGNLKKFIKQHNTDLILDKELTDKMNNIRYVDLDMDK